MVVLFQVPPKKSKVHSEEILDLLNEESVSGARSGRASLFHRECESTAKVPFKFLGGSYTCVHIIYTLYMYTNGHQHQSHTVHKTCLRMRVQDNNEVYNLASM